MLCSLFFKCMCGVGNSMSHLSLIYSHCIVPQRGLNMSSVPWLFTAKNPNMHMTLLESHSGFYFYIHLHTTLPNLTNILFLYWLVNCIMCAVAYWGVRRGAPGPSPSPLSPPPPKKKKKKKNIKRSPAFI